MSPLLGGLELLMDPSSLLALILGLLVGFAVGLLPGFSSANAAAIALPLTVTLPVEQALMMMIAIYSGSFFAGSVPAILLNVPGEAGSAVTALDGYPLARQGKANMAIGIARLASTIGGVLSMIVVIVVMQPLSSLALSFTAREMTLVVAFGVLLIGGLVASSPGKGLLTAAMGMLIATMAASPVTAEVRFNTGFVELFEGVPLVPILIGLFGFAQLFHLVAEKGLLDDQGPGPQTGLVQTSGVRGFLQDMRLDVHAGIRETLQFPRTLVRSTFIGLVVGIIPGAGGAVGNFLSWSAARRASKDPSAFGKGAPEGVVASEAGDNAVSSGTLVPLITLGIPGSATSAVMLGALVLHGIPPGPRVLADYSVEIYAVLFGALLASILILPLGILLSAPFTAIMRVPTSILVPLILFLSTAGVFADRNQMFDVWLGLIFGIVGFFMIRYDYPIIPMVVGFILGPMGEEFLMRSLKLGDNSFGYFFQSKVAVVLWVMLIGVIVAAALRSRGSRGKVGKSYADPRFTSEGL